MKKFIRNKLVIDDSIDIDSTNITPGEKLKIGVILAFKNSKVFKPFKDRKAMRELRLYQENVLKLKQSIIPLIHLELVNNKSLDEKGYVAKSMILRISSKYRKELDEVLASRELNGFIIKKLHVNDDLNKSFDNMPLFVEVTKKEVDYDEV